MPDLDSSFTPSNSIEAPNGGPAILVRPERRPYALHALLFLATVLSTTLVGAQLEANFAAGAPPFSDGFFELRWLITEPERMVSGLLFSLALLLILMTHEMGHFVACLRYRVYATLPFFIPAPTLIGTLGAFIRIKSPIPSRRALFDIGVAGPIAGFIMALPVLALGLHRSRLVAASPGTEELQLGFPLIFKLFLPFAPAARPEHAMRLQDVALHPFAIAAWVGMLATMLNLLPAGQLDGGHIVYALWPRWHRAISFATVITLLVIGLMPLLWSGWLLWAAILLAFGTRHPFVPHSPGLGAKRRMVALLTLAIFVLSFMPSPVEGTGLDWQAAVKAVRSLMHF